MAHFSEFKRYFGITRDAQLAYAHGADVRGEQNGDAARSVAALHSEAAYRFGSDWNPAASGASAEASPVHRGFARLATEDGRLVARLVGLRLAVETSPLRSVNLAAKRAMDIVLASLALLLLAPLLLGVAAAIKLTSKGPVFFRQQRTGLGNLPFEILKFRSMYTDRGDQTGVAQTVEGDPRITPVGRFIRRTSIDELPQLINVLRGDMSVIGPRPHVPGMLAGGMLYEDLVPYYDQRHQMRPGISGLAQVKGFRGPTSDPVKARARVDHDLLYVQNFSVWLDIKIVAMTVWTEFVTGSGF